MSLEYFELLSVDRFFSFEMNLVFVVFCQSKVVFVEADGFLVFEKYIDVIFMVFFRYLEITIIGDNISIKSANVKLNINDICNLISLSSERFN
jgi:hypothetical protein